MCRKARSVPASPDSDPPLRAVVRQSRRAAMLRSQTRIQRRYPARQQPVGNKLLRVVQRFVQLARRFGDIFHCDQPVAYDVYPALYLLHRIQTDGRSRVHSRPVGHQRTRGLAVALPAHLLERCERQALFDLRQLGLQIIPYAARAIATPQFAPQTACRSFG